jgi:hypothetical protein
MCRFLQADIEIAKTPIGLGHPVPVADEVPPKEQRYFLKV